MWLAVQSGEYKCTLRGSLFKFIQLKMRYYYCFKKMSKLNRITHY